MRFLHLSDLHIGLKLMNRDLGEDQAFILRQIVARAAELKPEAVVIAGDIYDKAVPSAEAVETFDGFVASLSRALPGAEIMMISGNHDSAPRVNCFRSVLARQKIHMIGLPPQQEGESIERVTLTDDYGPVHFYLLPFVRPSMVRMATGMNPNGSALSYDQAVRRLIQREKIDPAQRNVLVSHQFYLPRGKGPDAVERMDSEIRTVGNIDAIGADVLEKFDYAALGHIHKAMTLGGEAMRYSGTPMACSVSEAGQEKGMLLVEMGEKGSVSVEKIPLLPLRRIRIVRGTGAEALKQACDDYVRVELTEAASEGEGELQERLRSAFPRLLEVVRVARTAAEEEHLGTEQRPQTDPYALCRAFLGEMNETDEAILRDVLNAVMGGGVQ